MNDPEEENPEDLAENLNEAELDERVVSNNNQEPSQIPNSNSSHFKNEPGPFNTNQSLLVCDKIDILKQ